MILLQVFLLQVIVVELSVKVLVIVDPPSDHVRVLFVVVARSRLPNSGDSARVVTNVISGEGLVSPKHVLSPQVRVHAAFVHSSVRLEVVSDVLFVLLNGKFDVLRVSISGQNPVEVPSDTVLFVVEAVVVGSADRENVLCHQLADHAPKDYSVRIGGAGGTYL